jgi:NAD(P)H-dependent flavin oxidoreductase YrpB (nitropropane dioxygenase family)
MQLPKTLKQGLQSPVILAVIGLGATVALALAIVLALLQTGHSVSENAALIGAVIALGGVFTTQMVNTGLENRRAQEARALEDTRAKQAIELEKERARETALQKYLEQVGKLLIDHPLPDPNPNDKLSDVSVFVWAKALVMDPWLRVPNEDNSTNSAREVARAQTLATLEVLNPARKRILLQFLYELELINKD